MEYEPCGNFRGMKLVSLLSSWRLQALIKVIRLLFSSVTVGYTLNRHLAKLLSATIRPTVWNTRRHRKSSWMYCQNIQLDCSVAEALPYDNTYRDLVNFVSLQSSISPSANTVRALFSIGTVRAALPAHFTKRFKKTLGTSIRNNFGYNTVFWMFYEGRSFIRYFSKRPSRRFVSLSSAI